MAITLYDFTPAPSPRRARILLAEKGIVVDSVQVDMMKAEQLGDAYKEINPGCTVPALKLDDGTVLTENAGIAAWAGCDVECESRTRRLDGHCRNFA